MHRKSVISAATAAAVFAPALLSPISTAIAQQSNTTISPFVSFLPSAGTSPLAGLALTLAGNGGIGLRASGHLALENSNSGFATAGSMRPWGADADAVLLLGSRGLTPFVFAGLGMSSSDSLGFRATHHNWSYGAGANLPLGSAIDVFGEARWRMSRYVLPTANLAPSPTNELRVGLSFHIGGGGGGSSSGGRRYPRDRRLDVTTSSGSTASRFPMTAPATTAPATTAPATTAPATTAAVRLVGTADQYVGTPYRYGGTSTSTGFDCSGFVQYVFEKHGVRLPRTAAQQAQVGQPLTPDWRALSAGDLVMFTNDGRIDHVAIYAGRNRIIHSSATGGGVRYDDLSTTRGEWFANHLVAARRVTPSPRGLMLDLARDFSDVGLVLDPPDHAPRAR